MESATKDVDVDSWSRLLNGVTYIWNAHVSTTGNNDNVDNTNELPEQAERERVMTEIVLNEDRVNANLDKDATTLSSV